MFVICWFEYVKESSLHHSEKKIEIELEETGVEVVEVDEIDEYLFGDS